MDLPADPRTDDLHYVYDNQVRFSETDAEGVVFYGEYVTYQDATFTTYLQEIGYPYEQLERDGVTMPVVHTDVDYHASATFGDSLTNGMRADSLGETSIEFAWACRREGGEVVATGHVTHVVVDLDTREPTRVPDDLRAAVLEFQDLPPERS